MAKAGSGADMSVTTLLWLRRDLRLGDHPGWRAALAGDGPVVPVFVLDEGFEGYGAAPAWRLGESLADLAATLAARGSRLVLRRGPAVAALEALVEETGARRVVRSRLYDSRSRARDRDVGEALAARGVEVVDVNASLLFEPDTVETGQGGPYKVFTPFWRAVRGREVAEPLAAPRDLAPPEDWPRSDRLADWRLGAAMNRGAAVVAPPCAGRRGGGARTAGRLCRGRHPALCRPARLSGRGRDLGAERAPDLWRDLAAHRLARRSRRAARGREPGRGVPARAGLARVRLSPAVAHAAHRDG